MGGKFGMELARTAIETGAVVVEDAVGDIGGLLDFGKTDASTDGVNASLGGRRHRPLSLRDAPKRQ